tara:strand:+ start:10882 stop:11262 length:381 start_codon:yes stop_codon:yes gene_type:complete
MLWLTKLLISIFFTAVCLAALPFVKYRNLFSCFQVSTLLSLFALPVSIATATTSIFVFMAVGWIPLVGAFSEIIAAFVSTFIFQTVALFVADKMVEGFEIKTISHTFYTVFILSLFNAIAFAILGI